MLKVGNSGLQVWTRRRRGCTRATDCCCYDDHVELHRHCGVSCSDAMSLDRGGPASITGWIADN